MARQMANMRAEAAFWSLCHTNLDIECPTGTVRIIKESGRAQPVATEMRTFQNAVPLITPRPIGAKCAAT